MKKTYKSEAMASIHQMATGMHRVGALSQEKMEELDAACLAPSDAAPDVKELRARLGLSQDQFALALGVRLTTLQGWEEKGRKPSGPSRVLLSIVEERPDVLRPARVARRPANPRNNPPEMKKNYASKILAAVHETAEGLHQVGAINDERMSEFDELCLEPEPPTPDVKQLRARLGLSQNEFAAELGVGVVRLRAWEKGTRKPTGTALRLLTIVEARPSVLKRRATTTTSSQRTTRGQRAQQAA